MPAWPAREVPQLPPLEKAIMMATTSSSGVGCGARSRLCPLAVGPMQVASLSSSGEWR